MYFKLGIDLFVMNFSC